MYVLSHIRCFEYFRTFSFVIPVPWSTKDESRAQLEHLDIIDLTVTCPDFMCHFEQGCKLVLQRLTFKCFTLILLILLVSSFLLLSLPIHRITKSEKEQTHG